MTSLNPLVQSMGSEGKPEKKRRTMTKTLAASGGRPASVNGDQLPLFAVLAAMVARGADRNFLLKGRSYGKGWAGGKRFLTIPLSRPILPPLHSSLYIKSFPCPTQEPLERAAGVPQRVLTGANGRQSVHRRK